MNAYSDIEVESDASFEGASSFNCVRHRDYIDTPGDLLSPPEVGMYEHCFSAAKLREFGQTTRSEILGQFDEEFNMDQYDDVLENLTLDDLDKFDIASEKRLLQSLNVTPLTDEVINYSRNLARVIAKEAVSNRRLAMVLASSATRKDKVLAK